MADVKISELDAASAAAGAMELETNNSGSSEKVTLDQVDDLLLGTTNGLIARTGTNTRAARAITAGTGITVSNGSGAAGNPTVAISVASQAEAEAGTDNTKGMTPLRGAQQIAALTPIDPFSAQLLHVRDEKANGTNGGSSVASTWNPRDLNAVITNEISGASLSSNQITLPAGTYFIDASAPGRSVRKNQLRVYSTTDSDSIVIGPDAGDIPSGQSVTALLRGRFTLSAQKTLRLEHYTSSAVSNEGLGISSGSGAGEVYTDCMIWKVA